MGLFSQFRLRTIRQACLLRTEDAVLEGEVGRFDCFLSAGLPEVRHVYTLKEEYTVGEATRGALAPLAESTGGTS